jgi:HSP20 family protein
MTALTFFNNTHNDIFDRFFGIDDTFNRSLIRETKDYHKPTVKETDDAYEISLISPGLEKSDFNITLEGKTITISYDVSDNQNSYSYATKYSKSYNLPSDGDAENITASYKNGVLIVSLPKSASAKPRAITVK